MVPLDRDAGRRDDHAAEAPARRRADGGPGRRATGLRDRRRGAGLVRERAGEPARRGHGGQRTRLARPGVADRGLVLELVPQARAARSVDGAVRAGRRLGRPLWTQAGRGADACAARQGAVGARLVRPGVHSARRGAGGRGAGRAGDAGLDLRVHGKAHRARGEFDAAIDWGRRALDLFTEIRRARGIAVQTRFVGETLLEAGRLDEALSWLTDALDRIQALDQETHNKALALGGLGEVYARLGRRADAARALLDAVAILQRGDAHVYEVRYVRALAEIADDETARRRFLRRAEQLYVVLGDPKADEMRALLDR
ncbi:tetratricopeptide repeat protein [Herbihabitans rhizosphaerae]|uniref:tetratricopeptide repeat protein n=1 Tax=Herbihabitans rhizosphaerae TaxID=1872711 RepID=UPI003BF8FB39